MGPQDGFLIAAVLVLAVAAGCRRDEQPAAAARGGPHRRTVIVLPPADVTAAESPEPPRPASPAPAPGPGLGEARDELDKLAQGARQLRHALLHADFRDVTDKKTKEAENDPR